MPDHSVVECRAPDGYWVALPYLRLFINADGSFYVDVIDGAIVTPDQWTAFGSSAKVQPFHRYET